MQVIVVAFNVHLLYIFIAITIHPICELLPTRDLIEEGTV